MNRVTIRECEYAGTFDLPEGTTIEQFNRDLFAATFQPVPEKEIDRNSEEGKAGMYGACGRRDGEK